MGSSLVLNRRPKVPAEDTAAFGAIAERFRRAGALEQAVSLCRDGLKKFPDHVSARVTLGWSLLDLGKYDEARVELEQVMRRAPDNLAAIRGLAELHDRFEHTLNLPMDGPGQWPPPPDTVEDDASTVDAGDSGVSEQFKAEMLAESEPAMAPAAMGLPLWTPGPASSQAEAASPAEVASVSVTPAASGMSSVREIDPFAGAPVPIAAQVVTARESVNPHTYEEATFEHTQEAGQFEAEAPVVAIAAQSGVTETEDFGETLGVNDDALAALIAEADSLDAAAALEVAGATDSLDLGSVESSIELESAIAIEPINEPQAVAVEPDIVVAEPQAVVVPEPEVVAVVEPRAAVAEFEVAEVQAAVVESEIAEPQAVFVEAEVAVSEPDAIAEVEAVIEPELSVVEPQAAAGVAEVIAFTRPAPAGDRVQVSVDAIAVPSKSAAQVVALERMLRRVQSRRRQLMAQSVA